VFIDERVEKNGRVLFRCRVEETRQWCGLEIPDWMFDSACGTVCPVDAPAVGYEALRSLKVQLATASNHDPIVKEAQGFEGGTDANDTESKTNSIRTVPSINSDPPVGSNTIGVEAKGDPVTVTIVPPALGESTRPPELRRPAMSDKVKSQHIGRKALLYVRQSSTYQVNHNLESQKLQYAMRQRLHILGWREIEVIDEDLGCSAAGTVTRSGFERMVAEVCMGKVGAVAAREVSRFARNSREWQQLVEVCRVVDTILVDQETIYDPRQSNDRLLLGLKGSLNEYELDLLRQRSLEARRQKARRGELIVRAPVGYVKSEGRLEKDPDRRVQEAILSVYSKFSELGTVRQTLLWFLEHDLLLPVQTVEGEIDWKRPRYATVYHMLTNPAYGGAYAYGKTEHVTEYEDGEPRQRCRHKARRQWLVLIPNTH
jgi:DNA invertase Pin-like site-specific DNA recombinase